ncbi:MAG: Frag1/DRAM/Sfk1 family protein [Hyphomicrobiaceae bacterium]|nr:Frag1/DRAM/Sfk1 family protein [Hyphomicrobiaceae bacterium]
MNLGFVPLVVALLPFTAIHVCYLIAASQGHVPWCIPYVDACTAISATGRQSPESHVFRAAIIPSGTLMLVYWVLVSAWLKTLLNRMAALRRTMVCFGLIAGLGLIAYATVLGEIGDGFTLQRRIGVRLFFGFTVLAQLLMAIQVDAASRQNPALELARAAHFLLAVSAATFLLGLISLVLWALYAGFDHIEHAFAWWLALLVLLHPLTVFVIWRTHGFQARFHFSA